MFQMIIIIIYFLYCPKILYQDKFEGTKGVTRNRKSRKTDNTMDKTTKGKTTIYKTVSQERQTIQWTKRRKEKQQSTKHCLRRAH
jgi:hypothetical protein